MRGLRLADYRLFVTVCHADMPLIVRRQDRRPVPGVTGIMPDPEGDVIPGRPHDDSILAPFMRQTVDAGGSGPPGR